MNIYYLANQVYQFSYAKPIYNRIGGTFLVTNTKKFLRFKKHLKNGNAFPEIKTFRNTPAVIKRDIKNLYDFDGVILSQSNTRINCNRNRCITIFIGHGTGDKKYGGNPQILESYNYHFLSGPKHLEKLRDVGVNIPDTDLIKIGNPRFDAYINGQIDREQCIENIGIVDRNRKNVLYAPTWKWGNGTLHKYVYHFCKELTREFNLIIRPHFFERQYIPIIKAWTKIQGIKHVYFSNPSDILNHDTLHDFAASDILISDTSSILYEYLITRKPVIIAQVDCDELHNMPESMDIRSVASIFDNSPGSDILKIVRRNLEDQGQKEKYQQLLHNCFYFNDGRCTDRAVAFINNLRTEI